MDDDGQTSDFLGTKAIHKIGNLQYTYSARLQYILIPTITKNKWVLCVYMQMCCVIFFPSKWLLASQGTSNVQGTFKRPKGLLSKKLRCHSFSLESGYV